MPDVGRPLLQNLTIVEVAAAVLAVTLAIFLRRPRHVLPVAPQSGRTAVGTTVSR